MRDIAVIIPCHDAAHLVGGQLAALARQRTRYDWEVVVVDDGSRDDLSGTVDRYRDALPAVRIIAHHPRRGTGAARNAGARASDARLLLFLDADDEVADGYLDAMAAALDEAGMVTAEIDYRRLNSPRVLRSTPPDQLCDVLTPSLFLPNVPGGLMGTTRELFDELGGFDEQLPALADIDLSWRAQLAGRRIAVAATVVSVALRTTHRARLRRARFQARDAVVLRAKFAGQGLDPVGRAEHAREWIRLAGLLPGVVRPAGRARLAWQLGWQLGSLDTLRGARRAGGARALPAGSAAPVRPWRRQAS
ncbi:glycosyltransferase family A protein [Streptomyces sp. NPDC046870]|uniref:glycosyltransferase family 2 protein n=1 Tax=Streptomyces sp. NPDC046870 TaxID=3155135 RepID=UPI0034572EC5